MPERPSEHPNPWPERDPRDVETADQRPEEAPAEGKQQQPEPEPRETQRDTSESQGSR